MSVLWKLLSWLPIIYLIEFGYHVSKNDSDVYKNWHKTGQWGMIQLNQTSDSQQVIDLFSVIQS